MGSRVWPITALSVILAIAFALQLLAVLSVPVTKSITLCTYGSIQFGVFGYCDTKTNTCSAVQIGYGDVTSVDGFSLPSNARHTLASLLIVHVVAAGLTLILLFFTLMAHFPRAGSSSSYLLWILIFSLPCFLLSLLAFLVDILLFVPHLDWGGWIVLASTVLIAIFGVFLCVLRRTTSSRKAMERHNLDNAELHSLGQYNSAFSGGVSYKPTASTGDLIFSNSVEGYKSLNPPPLQFNEVKYESNVSNYSAGTEDDVPLTSNFQNQPVEPGFNSEPIRVYQDLYDQHRTPSPLQDHRNDNYQSQGDPTRYHMNSNREPQAQQSEYSQPEYAAYTDRPQNQYMEYPHPYSSEAHNMQSADNNESTFPSGVYNEANRPPSLISAIIPAGTYVNSPPQQEYIPHTSNTNSNNSYTHPQPQPQPPTATYGNPHPPSHSQAQPVQQFHPQQSMQQRNLNYAESSRTNDEVLTNFNRQPTISEVQEPEYRENAPSSRSRDSFSQQNFEQVPLNSYQGQRAGSSPDNHSSRDVGRYQTFGSQLELQQRAASQRHDLLLQSNPDFSVAGKFRGNKGPRVRGGVPAASSLKDLGDSGPYGISKMN